MSSEAIGGIRMDRHVTRRAFLGTSVASMAGVVVGCRGNQEQDTGPAIFLDYDETSLDAAYDQRVWAANMDDVLGRTRVRSEAALERLGPPIRERYGPSEVEDVDWYRTTQDNAPVHVHLHGGAWRSGSARGSAYAAEVFTHSGAHFVVPDYAMVQEVDGSLFPLAEQCRRAVAWVYENASSHGADRDRILVSGVSAGGHLAGVVLTTDWDRDFGLPADTVKQGLCVSGMFDLHPVALSSRNEYVAFTDEMVAELSPMNHLDLVSAEVVVAYGSLESPEFQRQSRDFFSALEVAGKRARLTVGDGYNHFEIAESLGNPYGLVGSTALNLMGLVP